MKQQARLNVECDPEDVLDFLVGETGRVLPEYGGFLIEVHDSTGFPWSAVIRTLLKLNHEIWIESRNGRLVIISKPKAD